MNEKNDFIKLSDDPTGLQPEKMGRIISIFFLSLLIIWLIVAIIVNIDRPVPEFLVPLPLQLLGTAAGVFSLISLSGGNRKRAVFLALAAPAIFILASLVCFIIEGVKGDWYASILAQAGLVFAATGSALWFKLLPSIHGWLILPALNLLLNFFYYIVEFNKDLNWPRNRPIAGVEPSGIIQLIVDVIILAAAVIVAIFYFRQQRLSPRLYIIFVWLSVAPFVLYAGITKIETMTISPMLGWQFLSALVWTVYFSVSKRVKVTFIR